MVYTCHTYLEVVYVLLMPTYIQTNIQQESKDAHVLVLALEQNVHVKGSTQGGSCLRTYLTRSLRRRSSLRVCMRMRISVIDVFTGSSFSFSTYTGSLVHVVFCDGGQGE